MSMEKFEKPADKIEKIRIPDEEVQEWMKTLREGGFTDEEMDFMLMRLNKTYAQVKGKEDFERTLEELKKYVSTEYGKILTPEQIEDFREYYWKKFSL